MNKIDINKIIIESIKNFLNEEKTYDKLRALDKWYKDEQKILDTYLDNGGDFNKWVLKRKLLAKRYYTEKNKLDNNDLFGLKGDKNVKSIYHYTTVEALIDIINDNALFSGDNDEYGGISFSTNPNLYKRGFVFQHGTDEFKGRDSSNSGVKMKFDYVKMKNDGYDFKVGSETIGTHVGEEELRLKAGELENMKKYLIEVIILKNKETHTDLINTVSSDLQKNGIPFKIV